MKNSKSFPFEKARRISSKEVSEARKAIAKETGKKRRSRGRPPKPSKDKYQAIFIRLHPVVVQWAKKEAKRRKVGYQTVINEVLLKSVA